MTSGGRVVIVGAGFGGLSTARALAGHDVEVVVVDQRNHHTFQPLLYQVATAGLDAESIAHPVRGIFHGRLTFVIVGGGPTGVEMAGALMELFQMVLAKDFPRLDLGAARVVLVEALDRLIAAMHPSLGEHARRTLKARGVEVLLGRTVEAVDADAVRLDDGSVIPTRTLVWAAGVRPHPLVAALGLPLDSRGRVRVGPDLRVEGRPDVFVIGDAAGACDWRGRPYPQLAPVAMQQGRHVA